MSEQRSMSEDEQKWGSEKLQNRENDRQKILGFMIAKQGELMDVAAFAKALGMSNKDFICGLFWLISEGDLRVLMKGDLIQDILNECGEEKAIAFFNRISFVNTAKISGGSGGVPTTCPPHQYGGGSGKTPNIDFFASGNNGASGKNYCEWSIGGGSASEAGGRSAYVSVGGSGAFPGSYVAVSLPKSQWQPMDTAPKDGTKIFCINPDWDWPKVLVWKTNPRITLDHEKGRCENHLASYFGYPDEMNDYEFADPNNDERPIGWMPIPPYPQVLKGTAL